MEAIKKDRIMWAQFWNFRIAHIVNLSWFSFIQHYIIILYTYMNYDISYILMYNTVPESTTNLAAKTLQLTSIYTKHLSAPGSMGGLWHSTLAWNFSSFRLPVGAGNFGLKYPQTVVGVMFISPSHSSFQAEYHQQSQWPRCQVHHHLQSTLKSHHFQ